MKAGAVHVIQRHPIVRVQDPEAVPLNGHQEPQADPKGTAMAMEREAAAALLCPGDAMVPVATLSEGTNRVTDPIRTAPTLAGP